MRKLADSSSLRAERIMKTESKSHFTAGTIALPTDDMLCPRVVCTELKLLDFPPESIPLGVINRGSWGTVESLWISVPKEGPGHHFGVIG